MKNAHLFIFGFVQGVGYRQFVKQNAKKLGLTGWVKNDLSGRVEVVVQSSASSDQEAKEKIEQLIELCKKGPFLAEVKNIEEKWEDEKEKFTTFETLAS